MRDYRKVQEWREWDGWASDLFQIGRGRYRSQIVVLHGYAYKKYDPPMVKVFARKFSLGHYCVTIEPNPKIVFGNAFSPFTGRTARVIGWIKRNRKPIMKAWKTPSDRWDNQRLYEMRKRRW